MRWARVCAGQWIPRLRRYPEQRGELREHRGGQPRVRPERRQEPLADGGQFALGFGQQQPAQRAERLSDPVELQIPSVLVELAGHEPGIAAGCLRAQLVDERRLAHSRRPADQQHLAAAGEHAIEGLPQRGNLRVAAHQPGRGQQQRRQVMLSDPKRLCRMRVGVP